MDAREKLNECINGIGSFSDEELTLLFNHCRNLKIAKNDDLLKTGQVCSSAFFILKGACYQYRTNDIEEDIIELFTENDWALNHTSFVSQTPSTEAIKAFVDCEVLELEVHSLHKLICISPAFYQLGKLLQFTSLRLDFFDSSMTPKEKYLYVLDNKPQLLQAFPLKFIASYLKITPETLSRVRGLA